MRLKNHIILSSSLFLLASVSVKAQTVLPPIFNADETYLTEKDDRAKVYLSPQRIVWKSDESGKFVNNAQRLLKAGNGQAELVNKDLVVLKNDKGHKASILLDFGKELHGGLQIVTGMMKKNAPVKIRVRFGESVSEAMSEIDSLKGATNDHAIRDFTINVPWLGELEIGNTGFRFVRIDLVDDYSELLLKEVRALFLFRNVSYLGSFNSSDELLNKIWLTGAYTVQLNMQQYLWDGPKRDRLVWVGDMHPEVMTINNVFGYNEVVPKSLNLIKDVTPLPAWMNGISSYSMWWIRIQREWYQYQGNLDYLKKQKDYLVPLLDLLITKVKNGSEDLDGMRFLDWPTFANKPAVHAGLQAMMMMTLNDGAQLCRVLGETKTADKCEATIAEMKKHVPDPVGNKQAASLMALAGLMSAEKADKEIISIGDTKDFSTFYGYYMLEAKAKAGNYEGAIKNIKDYWGGMLSMGATTFWEDFDLDWMKNAGRIDEMLPEGKIDIHASYGAYSYKKLRHSLSHGWASGPTSWLTAHVLGVQVMEPGCKVLKIEPHLGDLKFVEGTFPTPYGVVKIKHTKMANGKINSKITAPKEVKIIKG